MCDPLCAPDPEIQFVKCMNHFMSNKYGKVTILATMKDINIVLKSTSMKVFRVNETDDDFLGDISNLVQTVKELIYKEHLINTTLNDQQLISRLWPFLDNKSVAMLYKEDENQTPDNMKKTKRAMLRSLWALVEQREYLFSQYFSDDKFVPKILGFCGHMYAMEYVPQSVGLPMQSFDPSIGRRTWKDKIKIALSLLELVNFLDETYKEPMYMCDGKPDNLGVIRTGQVKMIDTDVIYTFSSLQHRNCISGCNFLYCHMSCDVATGKCGKNLNNNLQVSI